MSARRTIIGGLVLMAAIAAQGQDAAQPSADWAFDHADTQLGLPLAALMAPADPTPPAPPTMRWDASEHGRDYPLVADQPWARQRDITLYAPRPNQQDYAYNHHVYVRAVDGVLYLMHSQSAHTEDTAGQRTIMWTSRDRGDSWRGPFTLCDRLDHDRGWADDDPERPGRISYPGQWLLQDGQVYAIITVDDCGRRRRDGMSRSRTGRGYLARAVSADGPSGELFWVGEDIDPYHADDPAIIDPPHRPELGAALLQQLRRPLAFPPYGSVPRPGNDQWCNAAALAPGRLLINPTTYRLPDHGPYLRLYRNVSRLSEHGPADRRVYARLSTDGRHWSDPVRTSIPTAHMFHDAHWLPTGQLVYVGNPAAPQRDPLFLAFSPDGLRFPAAGIFALRRDMPRKPRITTGHGKGGGAQQASCASLDGRLIIAYSVAKEDVVVSLVDLPPADLLD